MAAATEADIVAGWHETGRLLEAVRWRELASQTPEESRRAAFDMLQLGGLLPPNPACERCSGLIDMQRLFSRWRDRGPI
jgi:hypothetical protein